MVTTTSNRSRRIARRKPPVIWAAAASVVASFSVDVAIVQAAEPVPIDLSAFPGAHNTGVPKGTTLTPYDGPCEITEPDTVIDARIIECPLVIKAPRALITRSKAVRIDVDTPGASLTIEDSFVDGGKWIGPAIGFSDVTVRRSDIRGGQTSIQCTPNCLVEDSWLHGQYLQPSQPQHLGGFLSNGWGNVTLRHNTITCDVEDVGEGGCSGSAQIYADFSVLSRFTFERNFFQATPGGFCTSFGYNPTKPFGANPTFIVVKDNVWQRGKNGKCAAFGPTTSFAAGGEGNVWSGNVWEDGTVLEAR